MGTEMTKTPRATRESLQGWLVDALKAHGGSATIVEVCQHVWTRHEDDLRMSGNLFYTWQYDPGLSVALS